MPRRKQVTDDTLSLEEITPGRRTRRKICTKTDDDELQQNKIRKPISESAEPVIKKPKIVKKAREVSLKDSPESTDSGIGSAFQSRDCLENCPELEDSVLSIEKKSNVKLDKKKFKKTIKNKNNVTSKEVSNSNATIKNELNKNSTSNDKLSKSINNITSNKKLTKKSSQTNENKAKNVTSISSAKVNLETEIEESLCSKHSSSSVNSYSNDVSVKDETALEILTRLEFDIPASDTSNTVQEKLHDSDNDSSSDSDWEEVADGREQNLDDYNPAIPKDGVQITIDCPELKKKRKKKQFDWKEYVRLHINRQRKEIQLNAHKTHLLCLVAHGFYINDLLNSSLLKGYALSILPDDILQKTAGRKIDKIDSKGIQSIISWFCEFFMFDNVKQPFVEVQKHLSEYFCTKISLSPSEYNLLFIIIARALGFKTRYCVSLYPLSYKAQNLIKKPDSKHPKSSKKIEAEDTPSCSTVSDQTSTQTENTSKKSTKVKKEKSKASASSSNKKKKLNIKEDKQKAYPRRSTAKSYKMSSEESDFQDEDYVEKEEKPRKKSFKTAPSKQTNRSILSSDSAPSSPENNLLLYKIVCWSEIFCKPDKHWIPVECTQNIIDEPYKIENILRQPVTYILAFDNDSYAKDVTRRYCSEYMTSTVKYRVASDWWEETLEPFSPPNSKQDKEEEKKLEEMLINKPLPQTISAYKNHPLYALQRHLLKFEGIYPPDAAPVGFLRKEPVYARENVCQLHSRETWVKEARVVRAGEEAYKIVKARPKWDRIAGVMKTDLPLEIFGFWQTDPYKPPVAKDGKVPRNEYGNVELFKACMLPIGTVHLQIPGLNRVAKKLGIDCSPAVVGFDGHKGSIHPVYDGFVVCKEFKDTLLAAWDEDQENARKREEEKREKRIYGNWRKLIKGLLIRERIKLKYDVK